MSRKKQTIISEEEKTLPPPARILENPDGSAGPQATSTNVKTKTDIDVVETIKLPRGTTGIKHIARPAAKPASPVKPAIHPADLDDSSQPDKG